MTYVTKRCPHCSQSYSVLKPKSDYEYGSPLRSCSRCNKMFIDKSYREIAITGVDDIDNRRFAPGTVIAIIFSFFVTFMGFLESNIYAQIGGPILICLFGWMLISEISDYPKRQAYMQKQTEESYKRMSDPSYVEALGLCGYDVSKFKSKQNS